MAETTPPRRAEAAVCRRRRAHCSFRLRLSDKPRAVLKAPTAAPTGPAKRSQSRRGAEPCVDVPPTVVQIHRETMTSGLFPTASTRRGGEGSTTRACAV